ncbi:BLUF domain-containing protein [Erythrobacter sp. HA6-11]
MNTNLEQIIYTSIASPDVNGGDVFEIIAQASMRNKDRGITGILTFVRGRFFQAIEGSKEELDKLLQSLERDARHHSLKILHRRPIIERQFENWAMKRLDVKDIGSARREIRGLLAHHSDARTILSSFESFLNDESSKAA